MCMKGVWWPNANILKPIPCKISIIPAIPANFPNATTRWPAYWMLIRFHFQHELYLYTQFYIYSLLSKNYQFHRTFFRSQSAVRSFLALHPATPYCLVEPSSKWNEVQWPKVYWKWFFIFTIMQSYIRDETDLYCMWKETKCFVPLQWINWHLFYSKDNRGFR